MNTLVIEPKVVGDEGKSSIFFNDVMQYIGESSTESQREAYRKKAIREIRKALKSGPEF